MKKWCSILLSAALVLGSLGACDTSSSPQAEKNSILIGVSVYDAYDIFIGVLMDCFKQYARELETQHQVTVTILHESAGNSQIAQNTQVEGFISAGADILCVNLVDRTEASVVIDKAEGAGIPILFFNRELVEEDLERWDQLYYVGAPAEESGKMQGQLVVDILNQRFEEVDKNGDGVIQYVMLEGEAGHQDAIVRTEYSVNTCVDAGFALQRLETAIARWNTAQAETKMTGWLGQYGENIEVVFANNDAMALGAIAALERSGIPLEDWPVVVGIDGTPMGLQAVQDGRMAGTVLNDAEGQARGLLDLAWALTFGSEQPQNLSGGKYIRLPYQAITADNVAEFIRLYS